MEMVSQSFSSHEEVAFHYKLISFCEIKTVSSLNIIQFSVRLTKCYINSINTEVTATSIPRMVSSYL